VGGGIKKKKGKKPYFSALEFKLLSQIKGNSINVILIQNFSEAAILITCTM